MHRYVTSLAMDWRESLLYILAEVLQSNSSNRLGFSQLGQRPGSDLKTGEGIDFPLGEVLLINA